VAFDSEQRIRDAHYSRELRVKHEEIQSLDERLRGQQEKYE
jgi:hypothetical protein